MNHFKVKPLDRFFTLLLTLTLALPNSALALRQLNAGSEEGRVDDELRNRLINTPAAGVEEAADIKKVILVFEPEADRSLEAYQSALRQIADAGVVRLAAFSMDDISIRQTFQILVEAASLGKEVAKIIREFKARQASFDPFMDPPLSLTRDSKNKLIEFLSVVWTIEHSTPPAAGVEEGVVVGGVSVPYAGMVLNWYSNEEGMVPSELLDILDPEQDRIAVPLADISSDTIVHIQKGVLSGRVIDALEAAGVRVVPFDDLEKIPQATSGKENVYILDVPNGSEREWILDSSSIVINLRSASLDNRPNSPEELGALINVARAADDKVLKVGFIYRSDLQDSVIALDTQL